MASSWRASMSFVFLHLFCGPVDILAEELAKAGKEQGIVVETEGYDLAKGHDLRCPQLAAQIRAKARTGHYAGGHSGFPCSTFSKLRWRVAPGYPGPVRSRAHIYGLPGNTPQEQREADEGSWFAIASTEILTDIEKSATPGFEKPTTVENPPETGHSQAGSAWYLPEVFRWTERAGTEFADFNMCKYVTGDEPKHKKPCRFAGRLRGLHRLSGCCACPPGTVHSPVVETASKGSAAYPRELCRQYAKLVVETWVRSSNFRPSSLSLPSPLAPISVSPTASTSTSSTAPTRPPPTTSSPRPGARQDGFAGVAEAEWQGGGGKFGQLKARDSKRKRREEENKTAVGGLKRPIWSLERSPGMRSLGLRIDELFDQVASKKPELNGAAAEYGSPDFELDTELVETWRAELEKFFNVGQRGESVTLKPALHYKSPVHTELLNAWCRRGNDPEKHVATWLEKGAPLGANNTVEVCNIFPPKEDDGNIDVESECAVSAWEDRNYTSFVGAPEDAGEEMSRLQGLGFVKKLPVKRAEEYFQNPVVSKLGLIVKTRADGTKKRRVIVDARRSGANARAKCPERIVLPQPSDVHHSLRDMKALEPQLLRRCRAEGRELDDWAAEFAAGDFTDAFTHFPVAEGELGNCVSPAEPGYVYVFLALFFGHKSAPLIMCRFSALLSRLIQSLFWKAEVQLSTYIDDPLWMLVGSLRRRTRNLSLALLTLAALGVRMSWKKGARGSSVTWIGVSFSIRWREGCLLQSLLDPQGHDPGKGPPHCDRQGKLDVRHL